MNTRRYPRTMQQAFGPYTDHALQPMRGAWPERYAQRQRRERIARAADRAIVGIGLVAVCLIGWIVITRG